ncbi:MAG TPA: zinc-dependent alcohol dehydrogenase family protein [candidate division Zixibacteria bacterium]|nr:zinc-dependent alcohol dehydrogenase family protein [candidate division Zixibacteria bacterium]
MKAMILEAAKQPLLYKEVDDPKPNSQQVLLKVHACGVCRTDLHIVDGELTEPKLPLVIGHQIVGTVLECGSSTNKFAPGDRVGVPWLGWSCGECRYCLSGQENLCDKAKYTGYQIDGGYAEKCVADERFCFAVPRGYEDLQAAPLLCAGLIGFRSYRMTGEAERIGFYGFGAAAHILIQVARHHGRSVYAFTKDDDVEAQEFARSLGAVWAGGSEEKPPEELDAAIIFAPVGSLVPAALRSVRKGGVVVCGGIHMSDIPGFPYSILWGERVVRSVANLSREDGDKFLALAPEVPIRSEVHTYPLDKANDALNDLRSGRFTGAAVIVVATNE